jgi:CRP/FNR family transcriptional regulator
MISAVRVCLHHGHQQRGFGNGTAAVADRAGRSLRREVVPGDFSHEVADPSATIDAALVADPRLQAQRQVVSGGTVLFDVETTAEEVFFVHRGQVWLNRVRRGREAGDQVEVATECDDSRLVDIAGPGQWVGVAAVAGCPTHNSRAVAAGSTVVSRFRGERLLALLAERPGLLVRFTRGVALQLVAARREADSFVFDDCHARLIDTLIRLGQGAAASPTDDGRVRLRVTHQQLAQCIGVARETVSLALGELRRQNLLQTGRNQLLFCPLALRSARAA